MSQTTCGISKRVKPYKGGPGEPVAVNTSLGWVLSGQSKGEKLLIN